MKSKYPQIRKPAMLPKPPRYFLRAEIASGEVDTISTGHVLDDELAVAHSYASRTGRKCWVVDVLTNQTVYRIERRIFKCDPRQ